MRRRRSVTVSHDAHCFGSYCNQDYWTSNTTDTSAAHSILLLHICKARLKFNRQIMSDSSLKMDSVLHHHLPDTSHVFVTCSSARRRHRGCREGEWICQRVAAVCMICAKLTDPRLIWWMMFKCFRAFMLTSSKPADAWLSGCRGSRTEELSMFTLWCLLKPAALLSPPFEWRSCFPQSSELNGPFWRKCFKRALVSSWFIFISDSLNDDAISKMSESTSEVSQPPVAPCWSLKRM